MIGVFSRADHPKGYGFADGRAHGYVTLFVRGDNRFTGIFEAEEILNVQSRPRES